MNNHNNYNSKLLLARIKSCQDYLNNPPKDHPYRVILTDPRSGETFVKHGMGFDYDHISQVRSNLAQLKQLATKAGIKYY